MAKLKREITIERSCSDYAEARGWFEVKLEKCSKDGMPDRFYARKPEGVILVEYKRPDDGELSDSQIRRHKELRDHGVTVYVVDSLKQAKKILY